MIYSLVSIFSDKKRFMEFLEPEDPETIGFILSSLEPEKAGYILQELPEEKVCSIAALDSQKPGTRRKIERQSK